MSVPADPLPVEAPTVRVVLRRAAPRLVRDGFGPLAMFYAGWKLVGLVAGIGLAAAFGASLFVHERRQDRPALIVRLALLLVAIRAVVGLSAGSATVYLGQEVGIDVLLGVTVLASLTSSRPFAARFAGEIYTPPDEVAESDAFRHAMAVITAAWGVYFLARGVVRLGALLTLSTDRYALVIALTDAPFLVSLLAWSVWHTLRVLRRDERWRPLVAAGER